MATTPRLLPEGLARATATVLFSCMLAATVVQHAKAACGGMVMHAHRGSPGAPENSQASVRLAYEGQWDGAEVDLQQLRDQQWVLHHDPVMGRTTSVQGRSTRDLTSAAWQEVRLKDRQGRISTEPAPFLSTLLTQLPQSSDKVLNAEIKQVNASCEAAHNVVALMRDGRPDGRWFLTSIDRRQLQCVRKADPQGYLGQIVLDPQALAQRENPRMASRINPPVIDGTWLRRLVQEVGLPAGVHVDINTLVANPNLLAETKGLGLSVFTYHLGNDREHAQALRSQAMRTGLLPTGAIIDGDPSAFCQTIGLQ